MNRLYNFNYLFFKRKAILILLYGPKTRVYFSKYTLFNCQASLKIEHICLSARESMSTDHKQQRLPNISLKNLMNYLTLFVWLYCYFFLEQCSIALETFTPFKIFKIGINLQVRDIQRVRTKLNLPHQSPTIKFVFLARQTGPAYSWTKVLSSEYYRQVVICNVAHSRIFHCFNY